MVTHQRLDQLQEHGMVGEQMTNHLLIDIHHAITHLTSRIDKLISRIEKFQGALSGPEETSPVIGEKR